MAGSRSNTLLRMATLAAVVCILLGLLLLPRFRQADPEPDEFGDVLRLLAEEGISIIAVGDGLYEFNILSAAWDLCDPNIRSQTRGHVALSEDAVWYLDQDADYRYFVRRDTLGTEESQSVIVDLPRIPALISVNPSGTLLAYWIPSDDGREAGSLTVVDLSSGHKAVLYDGQVFDMAWLISQDALLLGTAAGLITVDMSGNMRNLGVEGQWPDTLSGDRIAYARWNNGKGACYTKRLGQKEDVAFTLENYVYCMDWDTGGRYALTGTLAWRRVLSFSYGVLVQVHDTQTGKTYKLPIAPFITRNVFWHKWRDYAAGNRADGSR